MGDAGSPSTNAGSSLTEDGGEGVGGFVDGGVGFSTRAGACTPRAASSFAWHQHAISMPPVNESVARWRAYADGGVKVEKWLVRCCVTRAV